MEENRASGAGRAWWVRGRLLIYCAVGLTVLDAAVWYCRDTWRRHDPDDYQEKMVGIRQYPSDLVLAGGSTVAEGLDPALLQGMAWKGQPLRTVYNFGLPGATTTEVWHGLKHGLAYHQPRLVIYGITASDLNDSRQEPHGPSSLMSSRDVLDLLSIKRTHKDWTLRHFVQAQLSACWGLWHFRNGIRLWAANQAHRLWPDGWPEAAGEAAGQLDYTASLRRPDGFAPLPGHRTRMLTSMKKGGFKQDYFDYLNDYRLGDHLAYLHRIVDWAQARQLDLVLVDMPVTADLDERLPACRDAFVVYRAALAEVERSRGVPVLRATRQATGIGDLHFADLIHLNQHGCKRLSIWVRRNLSTAENQAIGRQAGEGP